MSTVYSGGEKLEFLTIDQVKQKVALCRASIYKFAAAGQFPKPVKAGPVAVRWSSEEVERWMKERLDARAA